MNRVKRAGVKGKVVRGQERRVMGLEDRSGRKRGLRAREEKKGV